MGPKPDPVPHFLKFHRFAGCLFQGLKKKKKLLSFYVLFFKERAKNQFEKFNGKLKTFP